MKSTITTIIPTFQRPHLLKKAILSVLGQSYPHFQVCVYDNASGDETEEIVRNLMEKDSRIKYYRHPENIGMMANYQFALARVDTPFFSLLSDDDFLLPSFFETALQGFEQFPEIAFSACGVKAVDEHEQFVSSPLCIWDKEGYFAPREGLKEMIEKPILPIGILFNHELVKDVQIDCSQEIQMRWDTDYLLQIISRFPFLINRQLSAIFLSHSQGFSTARYREMGTSTEKFNDFLMATGNMHRRLVFNLRQFPLDKQIVDTAFSHQYMREVNAQVRNYIHLNMFSAAGEVVESYRKHVRGGKAYFGFLLMIWVYKNAIWAVPILRWALSYARKIINGNPKRRIIK